MDSNLEGQLLIAMPTMSDPRFARSVIYMCAHSEDGAMGLIINQRCKSIRFSDLLEQLELNERIAPITQSELDASRLVHSGGPVETGRGFVLHSQDYFSEASTLAIHDGVCLTATTEILKAIATGRGPKKSILALGYSGWAPGQLESEISANGWLHCRADLDLLFDTDIDSCYERALAKLGIAASNFFPEPGHA